MWNYFEKMADAIINDVNAGLRGYHTNMSMSKELLILDIVEERLLVIKEHIMKGILPYKDLMLSLNCIEVDCGDLTKCPCCSSDCGTPTAHFLIPQIIDFGKSILYIGSIDKRHSFIFYTQPLDKVESIRKYRKRGKNKPWVYIDITPNDKGLLDCYIFGAPLIKNISVTAVFKDLRQLDLFKCDCSSESDSNYSFIDTIIKERITKKKILYYKNLAPLNLPNDQQYSRG